MSFYPYVIVAWVLGIGAYGIVTSRNLIHLIVCLSVVQASTYVLLLAIGFRTDASPPIFQSSPTARAVDPVVQSITLTDIVVEATVTALLLALAVQAQKRFGSVDPGDLTRLQG
jgi:multicomponent Na+:H+ antiporter subunit C